MIAVAAAAWQRFWFREAPVATLAVVRALYGVLVLAWAIALLPDLQTFVSTEGFGGGGLQPTHWLPAKPWMVGVLHGALIAAAICLIVGIVPRASAAAVFLVMMAYTYRNPAVFNAGDGLMRLLAVYLILSPPAPWRWIRRRHVVWSNVPITGIRLIQVQLCVVYASSFLERLGGSTWRDGTAVAYAVRIADVARFPPPQVLTAWLPGVRLVTYAVLLFEGSFALLVWIRRARPWVLGAGVLMHVAIEATLMVGFFGWATLLCYVAFVPPESMAGWLHGAGRHASVLPDSTGRRRLSSTSPLRLLRSLVGRCSTAWGQASRT